MLEYSQIEFFAIKDNMLTGEMEMKQCIQVFGINYLK